VRRFDPDSRATIAERRNPYLYFLRTGLAIVGSSGASSHPDCVSDGF
jgi:hypothetical protein